ncbi:hypothetical protein RUM44_001661 [Polyplax serrata]|uniref:Uncharacterized protein n=1 Tax=Polyplax serrata TaxID=468196 RepID=A0ABR1AKN0_POLSC
MLPVGVNRRPQVQEEEVIDACVQHLDGNLFVKDTTDRNSVDANTKTVNQNLVCQHQGNGAEVQESTPGVADASTNHQVSQRKCNFWQNLEIPKRGNSQLSLPH